MRQEDEIREKKEQYMDVLATREDADMDYCVGWVDALSWALGKEYGTPRQRPDTGEW